MWSSSAASSASHRHSCRPTSAGAVVYWLAALGFAAASRRRRGQVFVAAAVLGLMAGFGRIVQGGHFLSDVVFSGIVVFAVIWVLAAWVFRLPAAEDAGIVSLPVVGDS